MAKKFWHVDVAAAQQHFVWLSQKTTKYFNGPLTGQEKGRDVHRRGISRGGIFPMTRDFVAVSAKTHHVKTTRRARSAPGGKLNPKGIVETYAKKGGWVDIDASVPRSVVGGNAQSDFRKSTAAPLLHVSTRRRWNGSCRRASVCPSGHEHLRRGTACRRSDPSSLA